MTIPMGNITRNYLRFFRLSPTQCALNIFRVLGSIEVLNERMNLNLTHHDVNWVYNLHHLTGQGYYLKSRYPEVRLIQCLPTSNKGLKEDFLIFSREWNDGLPCPTREGKLGGVIVVNLRILVYISLLFLIISASDKIFFNFNDSAKKRSTKPQLSLVNRENLDRILRFEVFVNEADGQLRAVHIIFGYTPISCTFQALKCVIKAKNPRLYHISVAYEGFLVPEGIPIPKGTPLTQPLFVATLLAEASSSQLVLQEEGEEKEKLEEEKSPEGIIDLSDSSDEFEVFDHPLSPKSTLANLDNQQADVSTLDEMGIQRKAKKCLMELIDSQLGKDVSGKSTQPKLPPPPKSPVLPPQPSLPSRPELADPKRKREQKGKDVVKAGRSRFVHEDEIWRVAKQPKSGQTLQTGVERRDNQPPEPRAWLPAPMLNGEPLRDDASIRNFNGGIGCHVASALEEVLLLPTNMVELWNIRKNEVFLNLKRYLGMV